MNSISRSFLLFLLPFAFAHGEVSGSTSGDLDGTADAAVVPIPDPPSADEFEKRIEGISKQNEGRTQCDALIKEYESRNRELAEYLDRYDGELDTDTVDAIRQEMAENENERRFLEENRDNPELFERDTGEFDDEPEDEEGEETEECEVDEDERFEGGEDGEDVGQSDQRLEKEEGMTEAEIAAEREAWNYEGISEAFAKGGKADIGHSISSAGSVLSSASGALGQIPGWKDTDRDLEKLIGRIKSGDLQKEAGAQPSAESGDNESGDGHSSSEKNRGGSSYLLEDEKELDDDPLTPEEVGSIAGFLDETTFSDLNWEFGGLDGSSAKTYGTVIGGLEMDKNGLRFEYDVDLSSWGLEETQYEGGPHGGAVACLFVLDSDGKWVGGKFDWISSSRQTRSFENIYGTGPEGAYEGWDLSNVPKSTTAAFVVVSADGKLRSNVITARWDR